MYVCMYVCMYSSAVQYCDYQYTEHKIKTILFIQLHLINLYLVSCIPQVCMQASYSVLVWFFLWRVGRYQLQVIRAYTSTVIIYCLLFPPSPPPPSSPLPPLCLNPSIIMHMQALLLFKRPGGRPLMQFQLGSQVARTLYIILSFIYVYTLLYSTIYSTSCCAERYGTGQIHITHTYTLRTYLQLVEYYYNLRPRLSHTGYRFTVTATYIQYTVLSSKLLILIGRVCGDMKLI